MKKIIRVIIRFFLTILMLILDIFIISKIFKSELSMIIKSIGFSLILLTSIILAINLLSNPTIKLNWFKKKSRKIRVSEKTPEFIQICNNLMSQYGGILEKSRYKVIEYIVLLAVILIIEFILTIYIKINVKMLIPLYVLPVLILTLKIVNKRKQFFEDYKNNIIRELVSIINSKFQYEYNGNGQMCDKYMEADFKEEEFNTYESTDYICGQVNDNIKIYLSRISLLNCSESGEVINTADTFLFAYNIVGFFSPNVVKIKKNKVINLIKDKVEMDSSEFEKYFDVVSDSRVVAMQILTHDVMQEIVYFYEKYNLNFEIVIKENKIYIKFETGDVFKLSLFKKVIDNDLLWVYYNILDFTISLSIRVNKVLEGLEI